MPAGWVRDRLSRHPYATGTATDDAVGHLVEVLPSSDEIFQTSIAQLLNRLLQVCPKLTRPACSTDP
jgi:hypothetical protein